MIPKPKVKSIHGEKIGKGFSRTELSQAGISIKRAVKLGILIDKRRRTSYEFNIEMLKEFLELIKEEKEEKKLKAMEKLKEIKKLEELEEKEIEEEELEEVDEEELERIKKEIEEEIKGEK